MKTDDPKLLEIKNKILSASQRKEQAAWEAVLSQESGRRVLMQLMNHFGLYQDCFDGNGQQMAKKVAQQNCAQFIRNRISFWAGGEVWALMEKEEMMRQTQDTNEIERETEKLEKEREGKK